MMKEFLLYCILLIVPISTSLNNEDGSRSRNRVLQMMEQLVANAEKAKKLAAAQNMEVIDSDVNQMVGVDGTVFWGGFEGRQVQGRRGVCQNSQGSFICCPGFKESSDVNLKCEPACPHGCENGECIEPGLCQCPGNHVLVKEEGRCVESCPKSCLNGNCVAKSLCHCKEGFYLHPSGEYCLLKK